MVDPSPEEILRRRAELHFSRGELTEAHWLLERLAAGDRGDDGDDKSSELDEPPQCRTLADAGLPETIVNTLEDRGLTLIGDLCGWTEPRLRLFRQFGDRQIERIKRAMAAHGCALRQPRRDEPTLALPPVVELCVLNRRSTPLSPRQRERVLEMLSAGRSQREVARAMGLRTRYPVWHVFRQFKLRVRRLIRQYGLTRAERKLGRVRWRLWITRRQRPCDHPLARARRRAQREAAAVNGGLRFKLQIEPRDEMLNSEP